MIAKRDDAARPSEELIIMQRPDTRRHGSAALGVGFVTLALFSLPAIACSRTASEPTGNAEVSARPTSVPRDTSAELPSPPVQAGAMAPRLRATEDALLMTWIEPSARAHGDTGEGVNSHRVRFARFVDEKWSAASTIVEGPKVVANWADAPSVVRAGDGALVAHWAEKSGTRAYAYDVVLARSTDGGDHWKRIGRAHDDETATEHGFVSLVPEGSGVRAFWLDGRETATTEAEPKHGAGAMTLRTAVVIGDTVSDGEVVDGRVCDCCGTSAAVTRRGPLVVYRDRQDDELRDIALVGRAEKQWSEPRLVHADGWRVEGCPVNGPMMATDGDRVAVAWYTYVDQRSRIRLSLSNDAGKTSADPIEIDQPVGRRSPIGRVDVVLDGDGAVVSWVASEREDAVVLVARVSADGGVGEPLTVARLSASRQSGFPQLERLGDRLLVAWTKAGKPTSVEMRALSLSELPAPNARARAAPNARELTKLHERYAAKGVRLVAVSVDGGRSADEIRAFTERRKLPYAIWHDPEDRASTTFGVSTLPANFVIGRDGTIVWSQTGALTAKDGSATRALDAALKRP